MPHKNTSQPEVVTTVYAILTCRTLRQHSNLSKLSFETVVLKGLAADGGLFLPEEVPTVKDWVCIHHIKHIDLAQLLASQDTPRAFKIIYLHY